MELYNARYNFKPLNYVHQWLQHELARFANGDSNKMLIELDELRLSSLSIFTK